MLGNDYGIRKIMLKITMVLVRNKPLVDQIRIWDSGNIIVYQIIGQWFLPQAVVFFLKIRKLLEDHQPESVKSLSKIHGNELSNKKVKS